MLIIAGAFEVDAAQGHVEEVDLARGAARGVGDEGGGSAVEDAAFDANRGREAVGNLHTDSI